jgi:very-short-patch-repair endonuclease
MSNEPDDGVLLHREAVRRFGGSHVRLMLRRGVWQQPDRRVVALHNGPLTWRQQVWAALLAGPSGSLVGGLTALQLDGFQGMSLRPVHVLMPARGRGPNSKLGTYHRTEVLPERHVAERSPRRTATARSAIDAAAWATTDRHARAIVLSVVRQRLVTVDALFAALEVRLVTRRQAVIKESLVDASDGIQSSLEQDFDRIIQRAGLPKPSRQRVVRRPSGSLYLDADYEAYALTVEVDGVPHTDVVAGENDAEREHVLVVLGRRVLRISAWLIRHRPQYVAAVLVAALRSGGWMGSPSAWGSVDFDELRAS